MRIRIQNTYPHTYKMTLILEAHLNEKWDSDTYKMTWILESQLNEKWDPDTYKMKWILSSWRLGLIFAPFLNNS